MRGVLAFGLIAMIECARGPYEYAGSEGTGTTSEGSTGSGSTSTGWAITTTSGGLDDDSTTGSSDTGPEVPSCDIATQDCPPGEKCTFWSSTGGSWNGTRCIEIVEEPAGLGEPCNVEGDPYSGIDNCGLLAMCLFVDHDTLVGECVPICSYPTPECPSGEYQCHLSGGGPGICLPTCDPLGDDCAADQTCAPNPESFSCMHPADAAAPGEACEFVNVCQPGTFCGNPEIVMACDERVVPGCCIPFCNLDDPGLTCETFDPTSTCEPWYREDAPPEYAHVGACASVR